MVEGDARQYDPKLELIVL